MDIPDIYIYTLIAFFSMIIIMKSAGYIISAIVDYARKTGLSEFLIGSLVVATGTSLPELTTAFITSVNAQVYSVGNALESTNALSLGDILGANIIDVTLILGLMAVVGKRINIHGKVLDKTLIGVLVVSLLPLLFGIDGQISRFEGALLIITFLIYLYYAFRREGQFGTVKKEIYWQDIWQDIAIVAGCLIALLLSTNWLVFSAKKIAVIIGVSDFYMGLVLLALGTSIPELTIEITSVMRGTPGIAFGDLLGAVIMNATIVLGVAAMIHPIYFNAASLIPAALFMVTSVFISMIFIQKKEITWEEGIGLLLLYATFLATQLLPKA